MLVDEYNPSFVLLFVSTNYEHYVIVIIVSKYLLFRYILLNDRAKTFSEFPGLRNPW